MRVAAIVFVVLISSALAQEASQFPGAVKIDYAEAAQHRIEGKRPVLRFADTKPSDLSVSLDVVVGEDGSVLSARMTSGPEAAREAAEKAARTLRYKPFERDGHSVIAIVPDGLQLLPLERRPTVHAPFPELKDPATLRITLERASCYGPCPDYRVELWGNGDAVYSGRFNVALAGSHHWHVDPQAVRALVTRFREADFLSLDDKYHGNWTDNPTYTLSLAFDGVNKTVVDYMGPTVGMPMAAHDLEDEVDAVAGTRPWVKGGGDVLALLKQENYDFHARDKEHAMLLASVVQSGDVDTVRELLALGISPESSFGKGNTALSITAGLHSVEMLKLLLENGAGAHDVQALNAALISAARQGGLEQTHLLLDYGADPKIPESNSGYTVLMAAASGERPDVVREILKRHVDVNAHDNNQQTALYAAVENGSWKHEGADGPEVVRLLLEAGADPKIEAPYGSTVLHIFGVNPTIARQLIAAGANVNARDRLGQTPLFHASNSDVACLLLQAGADPLARDRTGETALDNARRMGSKDVIAMLQEAMRAAEARK